MTLTKQVKKSLKVRDGEVTSLKNRLVVEAVILPGIPDVKMSKDPKASRKESGKPTEQPPDGKLNRKPSLRRKFGALLRGSADLPAAINRGLQPIRRSVSFGKGLDQPQPPPKPIGLKPFRTRSVQWYNSLSSLAENEAEETKPTSFASQEQIYPSGVTRTQSFIDKTPDGVTKRRSNAGHTAPYGRHSDCYDFSIDLSKPPCEASSLPVLTQDTIDGEDVEPSKSHRWMEQQVKNGWGNLRASARNLSVLRGLGFSSGKRSGSHSTIRKATSNFEYLGNKGKNEASFNGNFWNVLYVSRLSPSRPYRSILKAIAIREVRMEVPLAE